MGGFYCLVDTSDDSETVRFFIQTYLEVELMNDLVACMRIKSKRGFGIMLVRRRILGLLVSAFFFVVIFDGVED